MKRFFIKTIKPLINKVKTATSRLFSARTAVHVRRGARNVTAFVKRNPRAVLAAAGSVTLAGILYASFDGKEEDLERLAASRGKSVDELDHSDFAAIRREAIRDAIESLRSLDSALDSHSHNGDTQAYGAAMSASESMFRVLESIDHAEVGVLAVTHSRYVSHLHAMGVTFQESSKSSSLIRNFIQLSERDESLSEIESDMNAVLEIAGSGVPLNSNVSL